MEDSNARELAKRHTYSFSREDLKKPPLAVTPYVFGNPVTRENFAAFIVWQFGVSRGSRFAQQIACEYVELQTGFNFRNAYRSYIDAGGFSILSPGEQTKIREALHRVGKHNKDGILEEFPENLDTELNELAINKESLLQEKVPGAEKLSRTDFLIKLDQVIKEDLVRNPTVYEG